MHENRRPQHRAFVVPSVLPWLLVLAVGCASQVPAAQMAAHQPERKNLAVLRQGTPRALVVAELGQPISSRENGQGRLDIFEFKQGYSRAAKTVRVILHGLADIATLGLWELVGPPIETIYSGQIVRVEVAYDAHDRVRSAKVLSPTPGEPVEAGPPSQGPATRP